MKTLAVRTTALFAVLVGLGASFATGCSSDGSDGETAGKSSGGTGGAPSGEGGQAEGGTASGEPTNSAVLVAGQVYAPEDWFTFVKVFPEVPEGDVKFTDFREFGNANVAVHGGRVFVEQDGVMQRFSVDENLELVDGPRFSWADLGIPTANATSTVFISNTRAYTFAPQLGVIVVWSPDTMERTSIIEVEYPERAEGMDTFANDGRVVGNKVIWNMFSGDFVAPAAYPSMTLAIADIDNDDPPVFVEDSRCLPGGPSFLADNGDYYVHGGGFFGFFYAYGGVEDARTCMLRVKAGETEFDPDYLLDYKDATGTYSNTPWIAVSGDKYLTRAWDPEVAFPESPDEYYDVDLRPLLVDASTGTSEPYPDANGLVDIDGTTRVVDGVSYFQLSETGYDVGGNTDVVELHPDGTRPKFSLSGGFLLTLERVR